MANHWQNYSYGNLSEEVDGILYKEEWKAVRIHNFPNSFEVSSFGRVKNIKTKLIRKQTLVKEGYLRIRITEKGLLHQTFVHILVGKMFMPNPLNLPEINHLKGVKTDNRSWMIEWTTRSGNIVHSFNEGLSKTGENHGKSKLSNAEALEIFNSKEPRKKIAEKFNISEATVKSIRSGRAWSRITNKKFIEKIA